jgi:hypothetical protein
MVARVIRSCVLLAGVGAIATGVSACGSASTAGTSGGVIVRVGRESVSKAMLDHWVPVESIISREPHPSAPLPRGFVPDPPTFSACAAYLQANGAAKTPVEQMKAQCRKDYEHVRRHMLVILITAAWLSEEAAAQHITVTNSETEHAYAEYKQSEFPNTAAYQQFVKYTGETPTDGLLIARSNIIAEKLREKLKATLSQPAVIRATQEFPKRWAAKTSCSPEYTIPDCKQYKGPEPAEVDI